MASQAPPSRYTVDDIVSAGQRVERRRRVVRITAGIAGPMAVVAAIAVSLPLIGSNGADAKTSQPGPAEQPTASFTPAAKPFTYTFKGYDVREYHVKDPAAVTTAYQIAPIAVDGHLAPDDKSAAALKGAPTGLPPRPEVSMYLVMYRPGAFAADQVTGAQRMTVSGRPALRKTGMDPVGRHQRFAWQYADDAWAALEIFSDNPDEVPVKDLEAIAAGLRPAPHRAAKVPYTVTYLPDGFKPVSVAMRSIGSQGASPDREKIELSTTAFAKTSLPTTGLVRPWDERDTVGKSDPGDGQIPGTFVIYATADGADNKYRTPGQTPPKEPTCLNGFCNMWSADGTVMLQVVGTGVSLTNEEMIKILKGVKLVTTATIQDESTWIESEGAFPVAP